jgi:hypothetical protein
VVGRLAFHEAGDLIDCQKMGIGGKAIPPHIDKVTNLQSDADFILLVRATHRIPPWFAAQESRVSSKPALFLLIWLGHRPPRSLISQPDEDISSSCI